MCARLGIPCLGNGVISVCARLGYDFFALNLRLVEYVLGTGLCGTAGV